MTNCQRGKAGDCVVRTSDCNKIAHTIRPQRRSVA
jgi:hypothetical protein